MCVLRCIRCALLWHLCPCPITHKVPFEKWSSPKIWKRRTLSLCWHRLITDQSTFCQILSVLKSLVSIQLPFLPYACVIRSLSPTYSEENASQSLLPSIRHCFTVFVVYGCLMRSLARKTAPTGKGHLPLLALYLAGLRLSCSKTLHTGQEAAKLVEYDIW